MDASIFNHLFLIASGIYIRVTILLTLVGTALLVARRASAAASHGLLLIGLAGLFVLPCLQIFASHWVIRYPTPRWITSNASEPPSRLVGPIFTENRQVLDKPNMSAITIRTAAHDTAASIQNAETTLSSSPPIRQVSKKPVIGGGNLWTSGILATWLAGFLILLLRLIISHIAAWRLIRRGTEPSLPSQDRDTLDIPGKRYCIVVSESISMPMTWGMSPAVILLPSQAEQSWTQSRWNAVLLHEAAHIRRRDWLTQLVSEIARAAYWPHPLVWLLARQCRVEAEKACDDAVLISGLPPSVYAAELMEYVRQARRSANGLATVAMADRGAMTARIRAILDSHRSRGGMRRRAALLVGLAGLAAATIIGVVRAGEAIQPDSYADKGSWTRTLPNGVTVELVGLTSDPQGGNTRGWWSPDGTPIADPRDQAPAFEEQIAGFGKPFQCRTLCFRVVSQRGSPDASTIGRIARPVPFETSNNYRGETGDGNGVALSPAVPALAKVAVAFQNPVSNFDYRFGVSTGPWRTLTVVRNTLHPVIADVHPFGWKGAYGAFIYLDNQPCAVDCDHNRVLNKLSLLPHGQATLGDVDRQFIARDAKGRIVPMDKWIKESGGDQIAILSPSLLARISQFELRVRDYTWMRFDNIHFLSTLPHGSISPVDAVNAPPVLPQFARTLPNGITVEFVGITSDPMGGDAQGWWSPDGAPIADPSTESSTFSQRLEGFGDQYQRRALYFRVRSDSGADDIGTIGAISRPAVLISGMLYHGESRISTDFKLAPMYPAWGKVAVAFNKPINDFDYGFGVSTGPWHTLATVPNTLHPILADVGSTVSTRPGYYVSSGYIVYVTVDAHPRVEEYHDHLRTTASLSLLPPGQAPLGDVDRRFLALDSQGQTVPVGQWNEQGDGSKSAVIPVEALQKITHFELQTRDYTWVQFDHVHNNPTVSKGVISSADDIPIPEALTAFSRALPAGGHLDVTAVMRSRTEGERWWRPDGSMLRGRIQDWATLAISPDWNRGIRPREVFIRYTSPRGDDLVYTVQSKTDSSTNYQTVLYGNIDLSGIGLSAQAVDYPINSVSDIGPNAREIYIRVGVTTGQWKRIASMPMTLTPQLLWRRTDGLRQTDAFLRLTSTPYLLFFDQSRKQRKQFFLTGNQEVPATYAERAVAVMKDGTRKTLLVDSSFYDRGEHGREAELVYQADNLHDVRQPVLSSIRRFELYVQPYTWEEYPAIPADPLE